MYTERHVVTLTTDGSGAATGYTPNLWGRILGIRYLKTDFSNGVTFSVTVESTGQTVWSEASVNASATRYPRDQVHNTSGTALTYNGTQTVNEPIAVANDRLVITVSSGGATKTGQVVVIVG